MKLISWKLLRSWCWQAQGRRLRPHLHPCLPWLSPWSLRCSSGTGTTEVQPISGYLAACPSDLLSQGFHSLPRGSLSLRNGLYRDQITISTGLLLLYGFLKCTTVLSSLNMLTSSMSCNGCTPVLDEEEENTELLDGRHKLLVLTDGLDINMLLLSSLGSFSDEHKC